MRPCADLGIRVVSPAKPIRRRARFTGTIALEQQTVNGFLFPAIYTTEDSADLLNILLNGIWSISSNDTSADAFKDFLNHTLGCPRLPSLGCAGKP